LRTARRALGKRQAQDERRGERERRRRDLLGYEKKERRGEGKRGGGERGERKKEIARREARTWQATGAGRAHRDLRRRVAGVRGEERGGKEEKRGEEKKRREGEEWIGEGRGKEKGEEGRERRK